LGLDNELRRWNSERERVCKVPKLHLPKTLSEENGNVLLDTEVREHNDQVERACKHLIGGRDLVKKRLQDAERVQSAMHIARRTADTPMRTAQEDSARGHFDDDDDW